MRFQPQAPAAPVSPAIAGASRNSAAACLGPRLDRDLLSARAAALGPAEEERVSTETTTMASAASAAGPAPASPKPGRGHRRDESRRCAATPSNASGLTAVPAHNPPRSAGRAAPSPARPPLSLRSRLTGASRPATALDAARPADLPAPLSASRIAGAARQAIRALRDGGLCDTAPAADIRTPANVSHLTTAPGAANHPLSLVPPNLSAVAVSQWPDGFDPEGQACSSRAKGKTGKDAGSANSSAIRATEDTASRRLAAARVASGLTERTHPATTTLRPSPVASAGTTSREVPALHATHNARPAREAGRKEEN